MTQNPQDFVIRRPRHVARQDANGRIWVQVDTAQGPEERDVELVDFSRMGAKFELQDAVFPNDQIVLRIQHAEGCLDVRLPATVRWKQNNAQGGWTAGCVFDSEVPYEIVGELFLRGILSTEAG